jgi:hypothetical protein
MSNELTVVVTHRIGEDRRSYFDIKFPSDQEKLTITHTTMMLAAGISLLVKAGHKKGEVEDYKLIEKVIEYLNNEFVSTDSFEDATIHPNTMKGT